MPAHVKAAAFVLLCTACALAQAPRQAQKNHMRMRKVAAQVPLLDRAVREAIVDTALDTHEWDYYGSDCSHFVNAIFEAVGLHFRYTNSTDLYDGTDRFRRVLHPEPGDLIVWRGHVGIVINPEEHSFYSMLRNGLRLASYDSEYWKGRGRPRFMRWVGPVPRRVHTVRVARLRNEGQ